MHRKSWIAALPRSVVDCAWTMLALGATATAASSASALPVQSWNGYHWARTGELSLALGDNLSAAWKPYFTTAAAQWSDASNIGFVATAGSTAAATCNAVYGSVQVCSGNYGKTGWLGYATVYTSNNFVVQATVKMNDYYFVSGKYNTPTWRAMTMCQEIGHTLGLAHANTNRYDANLGTCMDYSNDPAGTAGGANGTLANIAPSASDFAALDGIYATPDATQLAATRPQFRAGEALGLGDDIDVEVQALPEPGTWALLLIGFGGIGAAMRRRTAKAFA